MSVYTIGDLHLSVAKPDKSMEVFGRRWAGYTEKIQKNWERIVSSDDTVVIPGDISWGLTLEEAERDLAWIHALPGKKLLGKGNHDFFWSTGQKWSNSLQKTDMTIFPFSITMPLSLKILFSREHGDGLQILRARIFPRVPITQSSCFAKTPVSVFHSKRQAA